jgi:hypothetical protein
MFAGARGCCSPDGHCKTRNSPKQSSGRECNKIAFDHHKSVDHHIELPVIAAVAVDVPLRAFEAVERWHGIPFEPSPPDLQVLHSSFLI